MINIKKHYQRIKNNCKTHIISELTVLLLAAFFSGITLFFILCILFSKLGLFKQRHVDYDAERIRVVLEEQDYADRLKKQTDDRDFSNMVDQITKRLGDNACIASDDGTIISDSILSEIDFEKWKERSLLRDGIDSDGNFYSFFPFVRNDKVYYILNKTQLNGVYSYSLEWIMLISATIAISFFFINVLKYIRQKTLYIQKIGSCVIDIQHGKLNTIVPVEGNDELSSIASSLNEMEASINKLITKEKKEAKQKNELITGMAHDIKTPITVILGYLDIIHNKKYENDEKRDEYLQKAYIKAEALRKMIIMLFDAAKSQNTSGNNCSNIRFDLMLRQAVSEYEPIIKEKGINLESNIENTPEIYSNSEHMHAIIDNILSNAVKYCVSPGKIHISLHSDSNDILFTVSNTCEYINQDELNNIFGEFYRINKARNDYVDGNGLGLYIVKKTLEMYKGTVWAEYDNNTFTINARIK